MQGGGRRREAAGGRAAHQVEELVVLEQVGALLARLAHELEESLDRAQDLRLVEGRGARRLLDCGGCGGHRAARPQGAAEGAVGRGGCVRRFECARFEVGALTLRCAATWLAGAR